MYYISRIAGVAALIGLGIAVWFSIVLARADFYFRKATPESVERAVEIAPRNTEYLALRALQIEYEGGDSRALTEETAALNPYSSAPRIRLGLAAEVAGDSQTAERWLLDAARVDHQFEPRWTLANFYFRANRSEEFWKWMRSALEVSYGDRRPAFLLCQRVSSDGEEILTRAIPDRHDVIATYLVFLLEQQTLQNAAVCESARRLAAFHDAADLPVLFWTCDRLIEAHDARAVELWVFAGQARPAGIFNGDFRSTPINQGFDWRMPESPGVSHLNTPDGHRIKLSGQEAESCLLLKQILTVTSGKLQWESRMTGIKTPSGVEWRSGSQHDELTPSDDWKLGEMTIGAGDLELTYSRPLGESRAEGTIELRHVRLVAQ